MGHAGQYLNAGIDFLAPNGDGSGLTGIGHLPIRGSTVKTASFTAVRNQRTPCSLSGVSADIVVTPFSNPAAGERFGVKLEAAHSTHGYKISFLGTRVIDGVTVPGMSINGSTDDTVNGKWWLLIAGEELWLEYDGSTWWVIHDGRIDLTMAGYKSTNQTGETAGAFTRIQFDTVPVDNCHLATTGASAHVTIKRPGNYQCNTKGNSVSSLSGSVVNYATVLYNETTNKNLVWALECGGTRDVGCSNGSGLVTVAAGDVLQWRFYSNVGNLGIVGGYQQTSSFDLTEKRS